jgi:hypothetical protein
MSDPGLRLSAISRALRYNSIIRGRTRRRGGDKSVAKQILPLTEYFPIFRVPENSELLVAIWLCAGVSLRRTRNIKAKPAPDVRSLAARWNACRKPSVDAGELLDFKDNVRIMYCSNTQQLNPRFLRIVDKMAKTIGLTPALCEIQPDNVGRQNLPILG